VLAVGAVFRWQGLRWDEGHHLHPDERFISMVEEKLTAPKSLSAYFDSSRSSLNPYNHNEGSFVYGSLPMVLTKGVSALLGKKGYDGAYLVGRALSGLFDLITVWLVYLITRRFAHRRASLFAAALMAFCVLGIQLSHFWTVDTFLTTFTAAALLGAVRIAQGRGGTGSDVATGVALGLAIACKITALALIGPIGLGLLVAAYRNGARVAPTTARADVVPMTPRVAGFVPATLRAAARLAVILIPAAAVVRVALPNAFKGPSAFSLRLDPRWINDLKNLSAIQHSVAGFPPAVQWAGRTVLFPIENIVFYGAGIFFGVTGLLAVAWSIHAIVRRRELDLLPVTSHVLFLLAYHGLSLVKSIRYFYPAYPGMAVLAGVLFSAWLTRSPFPRLARAAAVTVLGGTFLWALAFTSIYRHTQTRVAASRWIFAHARPGQRFANESWDDPLPMGEANHDPSRYAGPSLPLVDPDSPKKAGEVVAALEGTDWIAVTSGRTYMNFTRVPAVFPMTIAYYRALFDGSLGFDRMADITSYPSLGPLRFPDDRAEEQFTVYDHPRVLLFRKSPRFSPDKAKALLLAAIPQTPPTMNDWERWPRALRRVTEPVRPDRRTTSETSPSPPALETAIGSSFVAALVWYLVLAVVGLVGAPLCWAAFPRLADRGFGFARLAGLVVATYVLTALLSAHAVPNGRRAAVLSLLFVAIAAAVFFLRDLHDFKRFLRENRRTLLLSEAVFAAGFLLFLGIRALNPAIYWGEKPMDFSILNILVRTRSLPASDPWLAGAPLGYYTFGHEIVVLLTFLTHLSTRFTFNLAFGLLGGVILQGAFSLARNWGGTLRAGIAGGALTLLLGNLSGLREWLIAKRHLDWDYFWATSRVIRDTINEYPLWSLTFADLHAHVLAIPIFLLFAAAALNLVRLHAEPAASTPRRIVAACLVGFLAAVQALTNVWDVPLLSGLLILVPLTAALAAPRVSLRSLGRGGVALLAAAVSAYAFARPLWVRIGNGPAIARNTEASAAGFDQFTAFGLFFVLALGWWLSAASDRLRDRGRGRGSRVVLVLAAIAALAALLWRWPDAFLAAATVLFLAAYVTLAELPEDRLAIAYLASAFFLVLFCQRFYIYDRMNTFFKLYLESWLLFSAATAVLVFRSRERRGTWDRWAWPGRALVALLALAALFTTVTGVRGALSRRFAPYDGPTLDGIRYLETLHPGEYRAVLWMRRSIEGTPAMLEAQGPSYQDFGRISMLTGLPAVIGWDYHVKQRGNSETEIESRKRAVETIYSTPDVARAEALLRRYRVAYVYVGWLERKTYPPAGLQKFKGNTDFQLVYENPEAQIYGFGGGGPSQEVLLPTTEDLPEAAAAAQPQDEPEEPPSILDKPAEAKPPFDGLREPRGMAVDDRGRIWIADFGHSRLRVYDPDGGFLGGWGGKGSGKFGFRELCGVAIRGETLAVADTWNGRILAFSTAGVPRAMATDLYGPRGVTIAPDGKVWASDTGNHRVVEYDAELQNPRFIGRKGAGWDEFSSPVGIAAGPSGTIYVADTVNRRIQVLNGDGTFRGHFAFPGWGENVEPQLATDADGTIYATDPGGAAVVALEPTAGRVVQRWTVDETGRKFENPTGIGLDPKRRILYVVNAGNSSISKLPLPERRTTP
jgi:YYY domain-containing protein